MDSSSLHLLIIVAFFDHKNGASAAMKRLKKAQQNKVIIRKAAVLDCHEKKLLRFIDLYDKRPGTGAVLGGVIGGFIGLLGGTVIVPLTIGALIGVLAGKLRESGFMEDKLTPLRNSLGPGTSLIVAEIEPDGIGEVEWLLQQAGATTSIHELRDNQVPSLKVCNEVKLSPDHSRNEPDFPVIIVSS